MRKIIIILITSILGLEITSCADAVKVGLKAEKVADAVKVGLKAEKVADAGKAGLKAEKVADAGKAGLKAEKVADAGKAGLKAQHEKKIRDAAYKKVLTYYEARGDKASIESAKHIAVLAASEKNRQLGGVIGDTAVTTIASCAATAAATNYQAKKKKVPVKVEELLSANRAALLKAAELEATGAAGAE